MNRKKPQAHTGNNSSALLNAEHRAAPECPPRSKLPEAPLERRESVRRVLTLLMTLPSHTPCYLLLERLTEFVHEGHRSSGATFTRNFFGKQYKHYYFYWWCVIRSCFVCTLLQGELSLSQDLFQNPCRVLQEPVYTMKRPPTCLTGWHLGFIGPSKPSCILCDLFGGRGVYSFLKLLFINRVKCAIKNCHLKINTVLTKVLTMTSSCM